MPVYTHNGDIVAVLSWTNCITLGGSNATLPILNSRSELSIVSPYFLIILRKEILYKVREINKALTD